MTEDAFSHEVADIAGGVFERREFRHYSSHRGLIIGRLVAAHLDEIRASVMISEKALAEAVQAERAAISRARRWAFWRTTALCLLLVAVLGVTIYLVFTSAETVSAKSGVDPKTGWFGRERPFLVVIAWAGSAVVSLLLISQRLMYRTAIKTIRERTTVARDVFRRTLDTAVQEALSSAINAELGPKGIILFPTHAPRLVELDVSQIRQSKTATYIKEFILEHASSAIGLAGTRGSGKSTVMRALWADPDMEGPVVIVPSPVRYDAGEFIRILLTEVASAVSATRGTRATNLVRNAFERLQVRSMLLIAGLGLLLLFLSDMTSSTSSTSRTSLGDTVDVIGGTALPLILIGVSLILLWLKFMVQMTATALPADVRRARELLRDLRWESERGDTRKAVAKVRGLFEASTERSIKLKSRALGRAELVGALRDLLRVFASSSDRTRMIVCVDELDKISNPEDLVEIVNELKDLFHIQKIHFLVTVSTDALDAFERRGLAGRDAFDSAFDNVVHTRWLDLEESLDVVQARATGFPPLLAALCHAWSGGLPRDLLRTARTAVEFQRREPDHLRSIAEITAHLVTSDLDAALRASLRDLEPDDPQTGDLWAVLQAVTAAKSPISSLTGLIATIDTSTFTTPVLRALQVKAQLGLSLLRLARTATALPDYWTTTPTASGLHAAATAHAEAVRVLAEPDPVRAAAARAAIGELELPTTHTDSHTDNGVPAGA
ncbi:P-loop NTPase fold protein [Actinosynnema sp. NPDC023658]|uniref:P-loop NTPase fold protein n=1 Tax=Actinosynnema sp. NPDC023658 TaxID=3155465 RepID=UPI003407778D